LGSLNKISANQLKTDGKGKAEPQGNHKKKDGKGQNSRIQFVKTRG
jgi:outer membrane protein OmpA-like peptidoglycan-associated protein